VILIIDNYDSFTFNLYQAIASLPEVGQEEVRVVRNDGADLETVRRWSPRAILLSPGPGHPRDAQLSLELPDAFPKTPILGVCLGHQALAHLAGARVERAPNPRHGSTVSIHHDERSPFRGVPNPFDAALYHSLIVRGDDLGNPWTACASTATGDIMGIRHRDRPHCGVQFHPESFMTAHGPKILANLLEW